MKSEDIIEDDALPQVVGIGAVVVDEQFFADRIPAEDEKEKATAVRQQIGGPVPTALATLRRFQRSCHFIGPWGDDVFGDAIEADFIKEGITWSEQCRAEGKSTGRAHVWTSNINGSRTIVSWHCGWEHFEFSRTDLKRLNNCQLLHVDGTGGDIVVEAARIVRQAGGRVMMDGGSPKKATHELLSLSHIVSFPERFVQQHFGHGDCNQALFDVRSQGADIAICTRGQQGAIVSAGDQMFSSTAFSVETKDSTGAGDVFCGGVIVGLLQDLSASKAVDLGAACAAVKCRNVGNRCALPTPTSVAELQASRRR